MLQGQVGRTPASHGSVYGSGGTEARASTTVGSVPESTAQPGWNPEVPFHGPTESSAQGHRH